MNELRLLPAALVVWAATWLVVATRQPWAAAGLVILVVGAALLWRQVGQALVLGSAGAAATVLAWMRCHWTWNLQQAPGVVQGRLATESRLVADGHLWLFRLRVLGQPAELTVFAPAASVQQPLPLGTPLRMAVHWRESARMGIAQIVGSAQEVSAGRLSGWPGWVAYVREAFRERVLSVTGPSAHGLLPGMVLGDTSLQSPEEQSWYVDTGLSHLCAVSGSNVATVTLGCVLLARALGAGPRGQSLIAGVGLGAFFCLVGPEPSVLRAVVTGVVGLCAVLGSATMPPVHGLCLAIIALLLWDSQLACQWGFALSVAATAGIVVFFPLFYRALARLPMPDIVVRALAVAIAADCSTMPLVAAMTGRVSVVSVVANLLVAPVVDVITIVGLVAVLVHLLPGGLDWPLLQVLRPLVGWVYLVAKHLSGWEHATVPIATQWVVVLYGWVLWVAGHPRIGRHAAGTSGGRQRRVPGREGAPGSRCGTARRARSRSPSPDGDPRGCL